MKSLSSLGIGLSLVFGCLLLALIAELYYLLVWKKKFINSDIESDDYTSSTREFFYLFCWRKPTSLSSTALNPQQICSSVNGHGHEPENHLELQSSSSKDLLLKPFGEDGVESEIMRLHNLAGPTRFLFTIKEETKEDLESDDGRSRTGRSRKGSRSKSLSDLLIAETPFATPLSSPPFYTPPLTPIEFHGFNPLFESRTDIEISKTRSSPPPKFKFLRDAEDKLCRKALIEAHRLNKNGEVVAETIKNGGVLAEEVKKGPVPCCSSSAMASDKEDGSFITIIIGKNSEQLQQHHSGSSQVLPLPSSPSEIKPGKWSKTKRHPYTMPLWRDVY